ncbi:MAG: prepilin-type N-terminal cleavage/methylation domain-containing protein [Polyangiaceae bacterium]|nr:prepilin-type N-terminal cleavage/methylation domain-containing protein [Polyangiaceae bacterium]
MRGVLMGKYRRKQRGSTIIEVLMAITVLAIGASGVIAMQKVAVSANRNSRNIAVANEIARTWLERTRADAILWNYPLNSPMSDLEADTLWLRRVTNDEPAFAPWFRPVDAIGICGIHDVFGRDEPCSVGEDSQGPYCVNMRLSWIRSTERSMRVEVRVFWVIRNDGEGALPASDLPCGDAVNPPDVDLMANNGIVRVVHAVTAVTMNDGPM